MGCGTSGLGSPEEQKLNKAIENQLKKDYNDQPTKLLLLGAGGSGKSTFLKQLQICNSGGFDEEERKSYIRGIHALCLKTIKTLIKGCEDLEIDFGHKDIAEKLKDIHFLDGHLSDDLADDLKAMWEDEGIQEAWNQRNKLQVTESAKIFLDDIERITAEDYTPTTQDVLYSRVQTTGIVEKEFSWKGQPFLAIDVGGQRNERRKWIHCFDTVTAIMFVAALSAYDEVLEEDLETNRMVEALELFNSICNSHYFAETAIILFLNKADLFTEKIKASSLEEYFPKYKGTSEDDAYKFIENMFRKKKQNKEKPLYAWKTTATETENARRVLEAVRDIVLGQNINSAFGV